MRIKVDKYFISQYPCGDYKMCFEEVKKAPAENLLQQKKKYKKTLIRHLRSLLTLKMKWQNCGRLGKKEEINAIRNEKVFC